MNQLQSLGICLRNLLEAKPEIFLEAVTLYSQSSSSGLNQRSLFKDEYVFGGVTIK